MSKKIEPRRYSQTEFAALVSGESGVGAADVERVLRAMYDVVGRVVVVGGSIAVTNFGTWRSIETPAGTRRNPQTGERFEVPATRRPAFRYAPAFKNAVRTGQAPKTFRKRGNGRGSQS